MRRRGFSVTACLAKVVSCRFYSRQFDKPLTKGCNSFIKKASITDTKNNLSRLLDEVKSGTTILILDRNKPVARLEPVAADSDTNSDRIARLVRQGLVSTPRHTLDLEEFLTWKRPRLPGGVNAVQFLIEDREDR